jgi:hypothetical protein
LAQSLPIGRLCAKKIEKKNGSQRRKAAKASGRQARGKEWLDFFAPAFRRQGFAPLREKRKRFSPAAGRYFVSNLLFNFKKEKKEIDLNSRRINMDFFISFGDGKFRCFGKKI